MKPGETRNPNGRPKKHESLTNLMQEFLDKKDPKLKRTYREIFIERTYALALKGDATAAKLVWNYLDGMPIQRQILENPDGTGLFEKITFNTTTDDVELLG